MKKKSSFYHWNLLLIIFFLVNLPKAFAVDSNPLQAQQTALISQAEEVDNIYLVENLSIKETSQNQKLAKEIAIKRASKEAFKIVVERLENKGVFLTRDFSDKEMEDAISSVTWNSEKMSGNLYSANLTLLLSDRYFRNLIEEYGYDYNKAIKSSNYTILIIPVLKVNGRFVMWENDKIWLPLWEDLSASNTNIKIVLGDSTDRVEITPDLLNIPNSQKVASVLKRYKATNALLAVSEYNYAPGGGNLQTSFYMQQLADPSNNLKVGEYNLRNSSGYNPVANESIQKMLSGLNESLASIVPPSENGGTAEFLLIFNSASQYLEIINKLMMSEYTINITRTYIRSDSVMINLEYSGNFNNLIANLESSGLYIRKRQNRNLISLL